MALQILMAPSGSLSRHSSPGKQNGGQRIVTAQKRQQALQTCLNLCDSLGFQATNLEDDEVNQTPLEVCQYVDAATYLFSLRMEAALKQSANQYGKLLDPNELENMVGPQLQLWMRFIYMYCFNISQTF